MQRCNRMTCLPSFRRLFVVAIIGSATAYAGVPPSRAPPLSAAAVAAARERAAAGSRDDHYLVGLLYTFGESLPRDVERALVHFRAAAALGHVGAATAAGALLEDSDAPDARGAALDFYRRAGRAGDAEAQYRAARLLLADPASGSGDAVVALLRQATSSGHAAAHWLLAVMLEAGWRGAAGNGVRAHRHLHVRNSTRLLQYLGDLGRTPAQGDVGISGVHVQEPWEGTTSADGSAPSPPIPAHADPRR